MTAVAYFILQNRIIHAQGENSLLKKAVGNDIKGKISPIIYVLSIASCYLNSWLAGIGYVLVALIWLVQDKRFERSLKENKD